MTSKSGTRNLKGRPARLSAAGTAAIVTAVIAVLMLGVFGSGAGAQTAPSLGGAESFAVLGGSTVTNTGATNVYGNLGVNPGTAVTGFETVDAGPGVVHGTIYTGTDGQAVSARSGVTAAFTSLNQACSTPDGDLTGEDLGGLTLVEGVYCFDTSAGMTGTLILDAEGNPDAVFIIRTGSTLITASGSSVSLINGANACNVFWQVGSSATLGTTTSFAGNLLAAESITLNAGANIIGRALSGTGAVTMNNNIVDVRLCTEVATAVPPATATAIAQATATAIALSTLTPVPPGTTTPGAPATTTPGTPATTTPGAPGTTTPGAPATTTPGTPATTTPGAPATTTPGTQATTTPGTQATTTTTVQQTATPATPGAPGVGSGSSGGPAPSSSFALAGAGLMVLGIGGFLAFATRRRSRTSQPDAQ